MTDIIQLKSALLKLSNVLTPEREEYLKSILTQDENTSLLWWFSGLVNNFESTIEETYKETMF